MNEEERVTLYFSVHIPFPFEHIMSGGIMLVKNCAVIHGARGAGDMWKFEKDGVQFEINGNNSDLIGLIYEREKTTQTTTS